MLRKEIKRITITHPKCLCLFIHVYSKCQVCSTPINWEPTGPGTVLFAKWMIYSSCPQIQSWEKNWHGKKIQCEQIGTNHRKRSIILLKEYFRKRYRNEINIYHVPLLCQDLCYKFVHIALYIIGNVSITTAKGFLVNGKQCWCLSTRKTTKPKLMTTSQDETVSYTTSAPNTQQR